jgi:hypothetical protein
MAGVAGRSGGWNRIGVTEHVLRGTFRADRHAVRLSEPEASPVSPADRARVLRGLAAEARRVAAGLLDEFDGWNTGSLQVLRQYAISAGRLAALECQPEPDVRAIHRETRICLQLLKALRLDEAPR